MKKLLLIVLVVGTLTAFGQTEIKPNIKEVTVFYVGAEINHDLDINLQPGLNKLVLKQVSGKIVTKTVQMLDKDLILINSSLKKKYSDEQMAEWNSEKANLGKQLEALDLKIKSLQEVNTPEALTGIFQFYEERGLDVARRLQAVNAKIKDAEKANDKADLQLLVSNSKPVKRKVRLKYIAGGAGWAPFYELSAKSGETTLDLHYIVKVMNQTGEEWEKVKLIMSSAFPLEEPQRKPELEPWLITGRRASTKEAIANSTQGISLLEGVEYVETFVPTTSAVVNVPGKQTVPGNGAIYSFSVYNKTLPIQMVYYAIPSVEPSPFLIARITNWKDLQLLDGPAKVNYNDINVGTTVVEVADAGDTLEIALGKDDGLSIDKSEISNETFTKETNNKYKSTYSYNFKVENKLKEKAEIYLIDQVPISQTNRVKVDVQEISSAIEDEESGELVWKFDLDPGKVKDNIKLSYSIEYPRSYGKGGKSYFYRQSYSWMSNKKRKSVRAKF